MTNWALHVTTAALRPLGPFDRGLDVCCGTGAGMQGLRSVCRGPVTGVDFSAGMLAQARSAHPDARWVRADARALPFAGAFSLAVSFGALGHFLPAERPALFTGVHRALRPGGLSAFPVGALPRVTSRLYWELLGFDLAMRIRAPSACLVEMVVSCDQPLDFRDLPGLQGTAGTSHVSE